MSELSLDAVRRSRLSVAAVDALPRYSAPVGVFLAVTAAAAVHGAYFDTAWGWNVLAYAGVAAVALLARERLAFPPREQLFAGGLAAFTGWVLLSATWSTSIPATAREVERDLIYVAGVVAFLLLVRRRALEATAGALLAAFVAVCCYSLLTRFFPDRMPPPSLISGYRLSEPIGYWNGLGIFAAMGTLLAAGLAARARPPLARALAAAALVPLTLTLYFTFSRGPWIALAVGMLALLAVYPRRLQLVTTVLVVAPAPAIAVFIASQFEALTRLDASVTEATQDGRRLLGVAILLAAAGGAATLALSVAEKSLDLGPRVRKVYAVALVVVACAAFAVVFARYGSPATIADNTWRSFKAPPVRVQADLNERLFSFSGGGRYREWQQAWAQAREHGLTGMGAGTFEDYWLEHRTSGGKVRDAHSLYLEVLGELGLVGFLLLVATLAVPLYAVWAGRRHPVVPAAAAAYVAWLVHAGVDWDWEVPAVTLPALLCACFALAARRQSSGGVPRTPVRAAGVVALAATAAAGVVIVMGNTAIDRAGAAIRTERWPAAADHARDAMRWAPWSAEGRRRLGQSEVATERYAAAERDLRAAIRKDPRNWELWFDLALATLGKTQERALATAERLNPQSPELAEFRAAVIEPRKQGKKSP